MTRCMNCYNNEAILSIPRTDFGNHPNLDKLLKFCGDCWEHLKFHEEQSYQDWEEWYKMSKNGSK